MYLFAPTRCVRCAYGSQCTRVRVCIHRRMYFERACQKIFRRAHVSVYVFVFASTRVMYLFALVWAYVYFFFGRVHRQSTGNEHNSHSHAWTCAHRICVADIYRNIIFTQLLINILVFITAPVYELHTVDVLSRDHCNHLDKVEPRRRAFPNLNQCAQHGDDWIRIGMVKTSSRDETKYGACSIRPAVKDNYKANANQIYVDCRLRGNESSVMP